MSLPPSPEATRPDDAALLTPAEARELQRLAAVDERQRRMGTLKDNLEAFTIALILALVIKHFCVEAFKIPTGSMTPTLYGENSSPYGDGDRILVDKWAYIFDGPERWDVIVFRYPLNRSKHFIKRVAGLGGEWLKIARGDLWTRKAETDPWRAETKRRRARDELYLPVYPPMTLGEEAGPWVDHAPAPTEYWDLDDAWTVSDYGALSYRGGPRATAGFLKRIGAETTPTSFDMEADGDLMSDARFRLEVRAASETTLTLRWRTEAERSVELVLGPAGAGVSAVRVERPERDLDAPLSVGLAPGVTTAVELECVDGHVYVRVGDQDVAEVDEGRRLTRIRRLDDFVHRFELEAEGGALDVTKFRVDRDLYYVDGGMPELGIDGDGVWIPEDHYFMLGDNTQGSSDSRKWRLRGVFLEGGEEIWYEVNGRDNVPHYEDDGYMHVVDLEGVERRWRTEDETSASRARSRRQPFVRRDLVVGRAFFVFWPLWPGFPGRAGFIH